MGGILIMTLFGNCNNYNYAKAVKKDTERIFKEKKTLIYSTAFKGIVKSKNKCEKCSINKFVVNIGIREINQKVEFEDESYPPYYLFKDDVLSLTVSQKVFEILSKGDTINKMSDSRFIESDNRQLEILNIEELLWLP